MRIHLIAAGQKMPLWVKHGFDDYNTRLPKEYKLRLCEIPLSKRGASPSGAGVVARYLEKEGEKMLAALPPHSHVVALAIDGDTWSSPELAQQLQRWSTLGKDVAMLVGGPDGLAPDALAATHQRWSLSALTLPHPLVRVLIAEQIYRAWTLLQGHPYHR